MLITNLFTFDRPFADYSHDSPKSSSKKEAPIFQNDHQMNHVKTHLSFKSEEDALLLSEKIYDGYIKSEMDTLLQNAPNAIKTQSKPLVLLFIHCIYSCSISG